MYLTAQRVVSRDGQEGTNAFYYRHGSDWSGEPPLEFRPENNPGELVTEHIEVQPPGNRVRSYLDLVAPDRSSDETLLSVVRNLVQQVELNPLPWNTTIDACLCRFHLDHDLLPRWRDELASLLRTALLLRG